LNGSLVVGDKGAARKTTADMLWVKVWTVPKPGHLAPANMPGTGSSVTLGNLPYRWGLYLGIAYGIGGFIYLFLAIAVFGKGDVSEGIGLFILTILMEIAAVLVMARSRVTLSPAACDTENSAGLCYQLLNALEVTLLNSSLRETYALTLKPGRGRMVDAKPYVLRAFG
jgi:hypothetical protein